MYISKIKNVSTLLQYSPHLPSFIHRSLYLFTPLCVLNLFLRLLFSSLFFFLPLSYNICTTLCICTGEINFGLSFFTFKMQILPKKTCTCVIIYLHLSNGKLYCSITSWESCMKNSSPCNSHPWCRISETRVKRGLRKSEGEKEGGREKIL